MSWVLLCASRLSLPMWMRIEAAFRMCVLSLRIICVQSCSVFKWLQVVVIFCSCWFSFCVSVVFSSDALVSFSFQNDRFTCAFHFLYVVIFSNTMHSMITISHGSQSTMEMSIWLIMVHHFHVHADLITALCIGAPHNTTQKITTKLRKKCSMQMCPGDNVIEFELSRFQHFCASNAFL